VNVKAGDIIESPPTGERIVFVQTSADTNGELLVFEHTFRPGGAVALAHRHPNQEERFEVLSGTPRFSMKGVEQNAGKGESVIVPPGTPHLFFNPTDAETVVRIELRPALRSEDMFVTLYELARSGRCNTKGIPRNPLVSALFARTFRDEVRPVGALWQALNLLSPGGAAVARLVGIKLPAPT
jgi:mannose-6-phosphate isomerase-like protein (cupin superfamily)